MSGLKLPSKKILAVVTAALIVAALFAANALRTGDATRSRSVQPLEAPGAPTAAESAAYFPSDEEAAPARIDQACQAD
jgi:hypothetical protein